MQESLLSERLESLVLVLRPLSIADLPLPEFTRVEIRQSTLKGDPRI